MRMTQEDYDAVITRRLSAKKPKYGNVKTAVDGILFDSKREAHRYYELKLMEKAGEITHLKLQPQFKCEINNVKICTYKADFEYHRLADNAWVVEDVKGMKTPVYNLKKRLVKAFHGVDVIEI